MKAHINRYDDGGPNLELCLETQRYYEHHKYVTRVKATGLLNADEAKQLAEIDSMTVAPDLLRTLSKTEEPDVDATESSIFKQETKEQVQVRELTSFINDETRYREAFTKSYEGKGAWKTKQVRLEVCLNVKECDVLK